MKRIKTRPAHRRSPRPPRKHPTRIRMQIRTKTRPNPVRAAKTMTTIRAAAPNRPPRRRSPLRRKSRRLHPSRPAVPDRPAARRISRPAVPDRPAARRINRPVVPDRPAARRISLPADRPVLPPAAAPARSRPVGLQVPPDRETDCKAYAEAYSRTYPGSYAEAHACPDSGADACSYA